MAKKRRILVITGNGDTLGVHQGYYLIFSNMGYGGHMAPHDWEVLDNDGNIIG